VGLPIQKKNEAFFGPEAKGEEDRDDVTPPHLTLKQTNANDAKTF